MYNKYDVKCNKHWYEYLENKDNYSSYSFCLEKNSKFYDIKLKNIPIESLYLEIDFLLSYQKKHYLSIYGLNNLNILIDYTNKYERKQKVIKLNLIC